MRTRIALACLLLLGFLFSVSSCVELTGQRITWHHDIAEDRLQILIHYDGIHEGNGMIRDKGTDQIPRFIANQEVLIMDWPFHFKRNAIDDEEEDPKGEWRQLVRSIEASAIGYYREPSGQLGALQLVTIEKVSNFLAELNRLISTSFVASGEGLRELRNTPRTQARMLHAAKEGHSWISLDGQALRFSWPIDSFEWAQTKRTILQDSILEIIAERDVERSDRIRMGALLTSLLSSVPVSYLEESESVTLIVGNRDRSQTMRLNLREEYENSLEAIVRSSVKNDLDHELAQTLLHGNEPDSNSAIGTLLSWGPPEEQVRPLMQLLGGNGNETRDRAQRRLQAWSENWNREHGWPNAPTESEDSETTRRAWTTWYRRIKGDPKVAK